MRLFFATDIHGSDACFSKFVNTPDAYGVEVLFFGGDYTGKTLNVCFRENNTWRAKSGNQLIEIGTHNELQEFRRTCSNRGQLTATLSREEFHEFEQNESFRQSTFESVHRE